MMRPHSALLEPQPLMVLAVERPRLAFGDELTNMLQPFWALPLLGITGLSARDILPYTLLVMVTAALVMLVGMSFW